MAKVYLIRLYLAAVSVLASFIIFLAASAATFPIPYIYQPTHLDPATWETRFQTLTYKMLSLPLLLGAMWNLYLWGGTRLTLNEVDALFALKLRKQSRLTGVLLEGDEASGAPPSALGGANAKTAPHAAGGEATPVAGLARGGRSMEDLLVNAGALADERTAVKEEQQLLASLVRAKQAGEMSVERLQELEGLLVRTKAQTMLLSEKEAEVRRQLEKQLSERSGAIHAVRSSKAFLGRGFRDIEMLLEAGFREIEDQRTSFMASRRKKLRQQIERDRARRAQRTAYVRPLSETAAKQLQRDGREDDDDDDDANSDSDSEGGESLDSFSSEALGGHRLGWDPMGPNEPSMSPP